MHPYTGIDKDVAGAYVIARRGLGFEEKLPKNYRELLKDKEFLAYAIAKVDERINKLKSELKKETNEYKKNALKKRIKRLRRYSSYCFPIHGTAGRVSQLPNKRLIVRRNR
jgi:hypothetical protein